MNRFVTTKGRFTALDSNGDPIRGSGTIDRGTTGTDIAYEYGRRKTATRSASTLVSAGFYSFQERKETYAYTEDGYLNSVSIAYGAVGATRAGADAAAAYAAPAAASGTGNIQALYVRDAMGRVTSYNEYSAAGYDFAGTNRVYHRLALYDARGATIQDGVTTTRSDGVSVSTTRFYYDSSQNGAGIWYGGVVTKADTSVVKDGTTQNSSVSTSFEWWNGAQRRVETYTGTTPGASKYQYDDAGDLAPIHIDETNDARDRTIWLRNDALGHILPRDEQDGSGNGDPREIHYYVNGIAIGDVSNNPVLSACLGRQSKGARRTSTMPRASTATSRSPAPARFRAAHRPAPLTPISTAAMIRSTA